MRVNYILTLILFAPILVLTPVKHPFTPKAWIAVAWLGALVGIATSLIAFPGRVDKLMFTLAMSTIPAFLATWYFVRSKRVNATYLKRLPVDAVDTVLAEGRTFSPERTKWNIRLFWFVFGVLAFIAVMAVIVGASGS
jgi:hypothetical protein